MKVAPHHRRGPSLRIVEPDPREVEIAARFVREGFYSDTSERIAQIVRDMEIEVEQARLDVDR